MFGDTEVVNKTSSAPCPDVPVAELRELESKITPLCTVEDDKDKIVYQLQNRVGILATCTFAAGQHVNDIHIHETKHTSYVRLFS